MIDFTLKSQYGYEDLVNLVRLLRGPGGCPWDGAQTHQSIRRNFIEEACEACEAMDRADPEHLREELGDVLLQVVFHAGIEADAGHFDMNGVCDGVCKKLIARHPHLFTENSSRPDWETLKRIQRGNQTVAQAMEGISKALPATWQADKILFKAEASGLYQADPAEARGDLTQALAALEGTPDADSQEEIGRALFALVRLARAAGIDPEAALLRQCIHFIRGFAQREAAAAEAAAKE